MIAQAASTTRTTKMPSLVSSEFFIIFSWGFTFQIRMQKLLHKRVVKLFDLFRRADRDNFPVGNDGNAVSHAKSELPVVRHHQSGDTGAPVQVQDFLADNHG